jgi:hypothetical protein
MRARFDIRKYSAAEIALLAIFALGLLLASFVVAHHNNIRLSAPIELRPAGLSVSLPVGAGWRDTQAWRGDQQGNGFVLAAQFDVGTRTEAVVQWRYRPDTNKGTLQEQLEQKVRVGEAGIVDAGQIWADVLIEWVRAQPEGGSADIFLGMAQINQGYVMELEAMAPADADLAEQLFKLAAKSLKFTPDRPL